MSYYAEPHIYGPQLHPSYSADIYYPPHHCSFVAVPPTPPFLEPQDPQYHVIETFATIEEANEFRKEAEAIQLRSRKRRLASRYVTPDDLRQLGTIILKTIIDAREKKANACRECYVLIEPCTDASVCDQHMHEKHE